MRPLVHVRQVPCMQVIDLHFHPRLPHPSQAFAFHAVAAHAVNQHVDLHSLPRLCGKGGRELLGHLSAPVDEGFETNRHLRPCDPGEHCRKDLHAVLQTPDPVSAENRRPQQLTH